MNFIYYLLEFIATLEKKLQEVTPVSRGSLMIIKRKPSEVKTTIMTLVSDHRLISSDLYRNFGFIDLITGSLPLKAIIILKYELLEEKTLFGISFIYVGLTFRICSHNLICFPGIIQCFVVTVVIFVDERCKFLLFFSVYFFFK